MWRQQVYITFYKPFILSTHFKSFYFIKSLFPMTSSKYLTHININHIYYNNIKLTYYQSTDSNCWLVMKKIMQG